MGALCLPAIYMRKLVSEWAHDSALNGCGRPKWPPANDVVFAVVVVYVMFVGGAILLAISWLLRFGSGPIIERRTKSNENHTNFLLKAKRNCCYNLSRFKLNLTVHWWVRPPLREASFKCYFCCCCYGIKSTLTSMIENFSYAALNGFLRFCGGGGERP